MRSIKAAFLATTFLASAISVASADVKVVASIKPVHSLVSAVMQGIGKPVLLVEGAGSPHTYSLKPSQARELQAADIVFWMSHDLEAFLENSIENIAKNAKSVSLMDSHGLIKLNFRDGGAFDAHGHDKHDDHDDHGHDKHDDHDDHGHDEVDPHAWLDPQNAKSFVHEIEEHLAEIDPKNAKRYSANASSLVKKLESLHIKRLNMEGMM